MLMLARSEPSVVVDEHQLDRHPWRLNCRNGTLDLKTGELSPHSRRDLITKCATAEYDPDAKAPCWEAFLERILPDRDVRQFLQRATGYALSGSITEQCLFLLLGGGSNGKTTYIEAIRSLLGKDYARTANFETLLMRRYEGGPREDITRLRGARFVSAIESDEGCRLSESVIKQLTGGDMIAARALYQSTIEFKPEFKLFLATNHQPEIRGTDNAIWRRIYLIPFGVRIPREERDSELSAKLRREHGGILAWAVRGCSRWQRSGLRLPEAVQSATARYREEMDPVAQFLRDCCDRGNGYRVPKREVFSEYRSWCDNRGLPSETENALGRRLKEKGFEGVRTSKDRFWRGLRVRVHTDGDRS